ncbi:pickpocket protein 28-like [Tenebrio molitor]|uniref:pickpocket protein 28-like n=1 Tax=Tenebrio molitor TaxID=7067 RepID=UPI0036249659
MPNKNQHSGPPKKEIRFSQSGTSDAKSANSPQTVSQKEVASPEEVELKTVNFDNRAMSPDEEAKSGASKSKLSGAEDKPNPGQSESAPNVIQKTVSKIKALRISASATISEKHFWPNLKTYVREFSDTIEIHGLRYLFEEGRSICERCFWLFVLFTSLAACIFLIVIVHRIFLHTPVIVSFSTKESPIFEVPFPAVTICSQVKASEKEFNFAKIHKNYDINGNFSSDEEFKYYQYFYLVCDHPLHQHNVSAYREKFVETLTDDFFNTIKDLSLNIDDIMHHCSFMGDTYNCSDLFKPVYTDLGVCFNFNMVHWKEIFLDTAVSYSGFYESSFHGTDWSSMKGFQSNEKIHTYPRRGFASGATNALVIHLKQSKTDVDAVCTTGISGFKITLHDPLQLPNFANYYIHVSLNTSVMVGIAPSLTQVSDVVKNLPPQTRKCYLSREKQLAFYRRYSQINCLTECLSNFTVELCGCAPYYLPRNRSTKICGAVKLECVSDAKDQFEIDTLEDTMHLENFDYDFDFHQSACDCKPFCAELKYAVDVSVSEWDWHDSYHELSTDTDFTEFDRSHFTIYFKHDYFRKLERIEFYGVADLLANIGGLLNFFVGASILTLIEIIYSFTIKIMCNKIIYGPWAGPGAVQYKFVEDR